MSLFTMTGHCRVCTGYKEISVVHGLCRTCSVMPAVPKNPPKAYAPTPLQIAEQVWKNRGIK